jgi:pimeloyl-ACP methyl ester carboxylesterase
MHAEGSPSDGGVRRDAPAMNERVRHTTTSHTLSSTYQRVGSGPPLVLLHGFIVDRRMWNRQVDDLSSDFDVISWDIPGCGESADTPEEFSMLEFAECLADLMDHAQITAAHLLGLSWGGTLALVFHERFPARVRSLILADTYAGWTGSLGVDAAGQRLNRCLQESRLEPGDWVPQWVPEAFSPGARQDLLEELGAIMWDFHPIGFRAMSRAVQPDFSDALAVVDVPTLLIWGQEDTRSPVACGEKMKNQIKGARLVIIPEAGHLSNMEEPQRFDAEVRTFLLSVEQARGISGP